jgi:hypothetical protein
MPSSVDFPPLEHCRGTSPSDRVTTTRGKGHISQGYFSGEILQYEIRADDGALFMAIEDELGLLPDYR